MSPSPRLSLLPALLLCCAAHAADAPRAAPEPPACPPGAGSKQVHAFLMAGNRAGYQLECRLPDGTREYRFEFNDRGRGPALQARITLGEDGAPRATRVDGHDYLKTPLDERFELNAGNATWKNKVEQGERALASPAFYLSQSGAPAEIGLLVQALRAAPGQRMALLPQGEARLEQLAMHRVQSGADTRELGLYTITGLGFQPLAVWMDPSGEWFAQLDAWSQLVPVGWEGAVAELLAAQEAELATRRREQAARLRRVPAGPLAIEHALLFDTAAARMRPGTTVLIEGDTIRAVGADGSVAIPAGAERIDAGGQALLPGLWDMHVHPEPDDGMVLLASGVTAVRDMAADPQKRERLRVFESGEALGPRVVFAGIVDGRGPFQGPTPVLVDTEAEARAAVQAMAAAGFVLVKIYSSVKPELVPAIVDEARRLGLRVGGHIPAFMTAEQAVRAGYNEIQHMNMLFLNFMFADVPDTRTPARFTAVAEHGAEIDPASSEVRAFITLLRERGVTVDPTLQIFENFFIDRPGQVATAYAGVGARLPPLLRRGLMEGGLPIPPGGESRYRDSFRAMQRMLLALHREGVPIVAGTDSNYGFALVRELELYVEAGIDSAQVLRMATLGAAQAAGQGERLGAVEPGRIADLILVEGDPSQRIADLRRLRLVVKDGALLDPDVLDTELGITPLQRTGT